MNETALSYISLAIILPGVPFIIWGVGTATGRRKITRRGIVRTFFFIVVLDWITYVILQTFIPGLMP